MNIRWVAAGWAVALSFFCVWSVFFGFRSEVAPRETIPAWSMYQRELPSGASLLEKLDTPLVRGQLIAAGLNESDLARGRLRQAVQWLDKGAVKDSVCARLRAGGAQSDVWVYSARLTLPARLMHWQVVWNRPEGVALLGRHNGWPVWKLAERDPGKSDPLFFAFADGMLFASTGACPDGVFDLLDQYDGLIA